MLRVNKQLAKTAPCPCQSGESYGNCCAPYHDKKRPAPTPMALMRSRFSAYVLDLRVYLINTWAPQTRPSQLPPPSLNWIALNVLEAPDPTKTATPEKGTVHFKAVYQDGNTWGFLEENSRFEKIEECWYYVNGDVREGILKPKRNEPCMCNSGKKFKACCGKG